MKWSKIMKRQTPEQASNKIQNTQSFLSNMRNTFAHTLTHSLTSRSNATSGSAELELFFVEIC